jgi:hypothetical protein
MGDLSDELYGLYTAGSFVFVRPEKTSASPTERQNDDDMAQTGQREKEKKEGTSCWALIRFSHKTAITLNRKFRSHYINIQLK